MNLYLDYQSKETFINFYNTFLDEKSYENILVYNILCKTFMDENTIAH